MGHRSPITMQELVRFAIKYQQDAENDSGTTLNNVRFDKGRKEFLKQLRLSMSVNSMKEFLAAIAVLQLPSSSDEDKNVALDTIKDYFDHTGFANSFIKMEDADIVLKYVRHSDPDICYSALEIICNMSERNCPCQQYFLQHGIIELLMNYFNNDHSIVVYGALGAIESLTKYFDPALVVFIKNGGVEKVAALLFSECPYVFFKACSLILYMSSFNLLKDEFAKINVFNKLAKKLCVVFEDTWICENYLELISVSIESRYCNPNEEESKDIIKFLKDLLKYHNEKDPYYGQCVVYAKSILNNLDYNK